MNCSWCNKIAILIKSCKHIQPTTLINEFLQKVTKSLYVNQLLSRANSVENAFELYKTLKVPFWKKQLICVNGETSVLKLGDVLELKLDKYF